MNTTLYLTRHGETEWNVISRMQGFEDSPLTELGKQQAEWLRNAMSTVPLDIIYSSPSPRAMLTAKIIRGEREVPIETSEALMEMGFGIWEGRIHSEVKSEFPEEWELFWNNPEMFRIEGSETYHQVQTRAIQKMQEIIQNHAGKSILIVTHTIVVKFIMAYFQGEDMQQLWSSSEISPASLSRIDIIDNVPKVILHGDTRHYQL